MCAGALVMKVHWNVPHNHCQLFSMSDTDNKKATKGTEHSGSKKRAAAAAAAAVAVAKAAPAATDSPEATEGNDIELDTTLEVPGSPKSKRPKHECKASVSSMDDGAIEGEDTINTPAMEDGPIDTKQDDNEIVAPPIDTKPTIKMTPETVLTMCGAARKLAGNVAMSIKGPPDVLTTASKPESFVLVMITNDVEHTSKMNKERESSFTAVNFVPVKILEAGFNSAPHEKVEGNAKNLVYCDKKGKLLEGRPTKLVTISCVNNVKNLDMKTWEQHPCAMMKTKWRGLPTGCVGVIAPGIPLSCNIFNENKDSIMDDDTTESNLKPFSFAIIGLVIKSREQCEAGYGIGVKSIRHLNSVNCTMTGLYHDMFFYSDKTSIESQTSERLAVKTRVSEYDHDLSFVSKLVRYVSKNATADKPVVTEKPIVCARLGGIDGNPAASHGHRVHMQPNNKVLELEMVDPTSIYHGKRFRISIPENMFTINETGLEWVQFYFQWMLDINACNILFVHDDYQYNRMAEGTATASMHCVIIPDESVLFSDQNPPLALSAGLSSALDKGVKGRSNSFSMYTGWTLRTDAASNKTYAIIFDKTKAYCPEEEKIEGEIVSADGSTVVDESGKSAEDTLAAIADANSEHTSIVCRIYKGMNVWRHIWRAYLLIIDNDKDTVERMFQIGIKSQAPYFDSNAGGVSANANIFESCDMVLA